MLSEKDMKKRKLKNLPRRIKRSLSEKKEKKRNISFEGDDHWNVSNESSEESSEFHQKEIKQIENKCKAISELLPSEINQKNFIMKTIKTMVDSDMNYNNSVSRDSPIEHSTPKIVYKPMSSTNQNADSTTQIDRLSVFSKKSTKKNSFRKSRRTKGRKMGKKKKKMSGKKKKKVKESRSKTFSFDSKPMPKSEHKVRTIRTGRQHAGGTLGDESQQFNLAVSNFLELWKGMLEEICRRPLRGDGMNLEHVKCLAAKLMIKCKKQEDMETIMMEALKPIVNNQNSTGILKRDPFLHMIYGLYAFQFKKYCRKMDPETDVEYLLDNGKRDVLAKFVLKNHNHLQEEQEDRIIEMFEQFNKDKSKNIPTLEEELSVKLFGEIS
ncbi:hypothetical protein SNEBB_010888 [Seison nebaliae]|nr:hypothetical protein SNEBB_010888 [Seison nebaliae]